MTDELDRDNVSADADQAQSPGQMLRAGRERMNLTIEQVAERLRLRQQIVQDLEQDQFSKYVSGTFTRGYLRAYARLVELNDEKVLAAYEALGVDDKPQAMQSFSRRRRQQSHDNKLMLVTYVVGAVIIGSAVVFWLQNNDANDAEIAGPQQRTTVAERVVDEQAPEVDLEPEQEMPADEPEAIYVNTGMLENPVDQMRFSADTTAEQSQLADTQLTEQAAQVQAAQEQATDRSAPTATSEPAPASTTQATATRASDSATEAAPEVPDADLVLIFSGDAWIRVEDASGEAIAFGVKPEGHVSELNGNAPYEVTLGAPENVRVYYQGQAIDLSSYRAGRVARITIPHTE